MKKQFTLSGILSVSIFSLLMVSSCDKEKEITVTDHDLYEMAIETNGFTWYKNSETLLNSTEESGHSQKLLKTRFNAVAATKLDANGKVIAGSVFPEGSLIVKELFDDGPEVSVYAIRLKNSDTGNSDDKGWVWTILGADGEVLETSLNKGKNCIKCHTQDDNIDYMLLNKFFP